MKEKHTKIEKYAHRDRGHKTERGRESKREREREREREKDIQSERERERKCDKITKVSIMIPQIEHLSEEKVAQAFIKGATPFCQLDILST